MSELRILVLLSLVALVTCKQCIKAGGTKKCTKGAGECDVSKGFVCMDIPKGASGVNISLCGEPQESGCWCDPSLTSAEACVEGLSCQEDNSKSFKCIHSEADDVECSGAEVAWKMVYHHDSNATAIAGDLDTLLTDLKNGAQVKVWTRLYGYVNIQKVTISMNGDITDETKIECAHGQALFWAFGGPGRMFKLYLIFSTNGIVHVTQFQVNSVVNDAVRENSNTMLDIKWFTRNNALKVTSESTLRTEIRDGSPVRVAVNDTFRNLEVVKLTDTQIAGITLHELEDINQGLEFHPNETRLLSHFSYNGRVVEACALLNQPTWTVSKEYLSQDLTWFLDPCWKAVYRHDISGQALFRSKQDLVDAIESGKRIGLRINRTLYEPNVVRQVNGEVVAVVFDSVGEHVEHGHWKWIQADTTGQYNITKFTVGGQTLLEEFSESATMTWFVDDKLWTQVTPENLYGKVSGGADVRYSITSGTDTSWYQADYAQKSVDDGIRPPFDVFTIYHEREVLLSGTDYVQRFHFLNWMTSTVTYVDYKVGNTAQKGFSLVPNAQISFFTNEVVA